MGRKRRGEWDVEENKSKEGRGGERKRMKGEKG